MSQTYSGVLVFGEQKDGLVHPVTFELLNKGGELAKTLGVDIMCVVCGPNDMNLSEVVARGADKVYHICSNKLFNYPEETIYAWNIHKLIERIKPEICLFGATSFGRSLAPRVAAYGGCGLTADCTGLQIDEDRYFVQIRPAFSENILAHIKSKTKPQMATIRYKEFNATSKDLNHEGEIIIIEAVNLDKKQVEVLEKLETEDFDITNQKVIVSGGMGLKSPEDLKLIEELAETLGGVVGASRPIVEEGYMSKAHQVGYSGNRVKPDIYIACGISGAPQHLAGMKESKLIVAINSDPSAPIFSIADIGIVGDLYKVIPEMINEIKKIKGDVLCC